MSLEDLSNNNDVCKMEEKFSLIRQTDIEFIGKYPLESITKDSRGTYGGDMVAQSLRAAWDSIDDRDFDIHSLHSYFLKAGSKESVMRYEVTTMSQGRTFCSKLVKCFQFHNDQLCFTLMASFTRKNSIEDRKKNFWALKEEDRRNPQTKIPFEFSSSPHFTFFKYRGKLDSMPVVEHTSGNISHIIPPETWRAPMRKKEGEAGTRVFGLFFKVNDNVKKARDVGKAKITSLAFASDSFYLATVTRAVLPTLDFKSSAFFRVSLDHTIYFHDINFDPSEWMFLDYKFERLSNDRVLVTSRYFTMNNRLVATASQEALCFFPLKLIEKNKLGTFKL